MRGSRAALLWSGAQPRASASRTTAVASSMRPTRAKALMRSAVVNSFSGTPSRLICSTASSTTERMRWSLAFLSRRLYTRVFCRFLAWASAARAAASRCDASRRTSSKRSRWAAPEGAQPKSRVPFSSLRFSSPLLSAEVAVQEAAGEEAAEEAAVEEATEEAVVEEATEEAATTLRRRCLEGAGAC